MTTETLTQGNSTVTTVPQQMAAGWIVSYFVNSPGSTATGAWTVECSNDGVTFTTYTLTSSPPAAAGSAQTFGVAIVGFEYAWVRLKFTGTGGAGTATVNTLKKAR